MRLPSARSTRSSHHFRPIFPNVAGALDDESIGEVGKDADEIAGASIEGSPPLYMRSRERALRQVRYASDPIQLCGQTFICVICG